MGERAGEGLSNLLSVMHTAIHREIRSRVYGSHSSPRFRVWDVLPEFPRTFRAGVGCAYGPGFALTVAFPAWVVLACFLSISSGASQPSWPGRAGFYSLKHIQCPVRVWPVRHAGAHVWDAGRILGRRADLPGKLRQGVTGVLEIICLMSRHNIWDPSGP